MAAGWWNATVTNTFPNIVLGRFSGNSREKMDGSYTSVSRRYNNKEEREWAGEGREKLWAVQLCEKVSIRSTYWSWPKTNKLKLNHRKDSESPCLKFSQTEDYHVTISKVWEKLSVFVVLSCINETNTLYNSYKAGWATAGWHRGRYGCRFMT